ncbi:unnamed protein product [Caenorhabditis brenneri]
MSELENDCERILLQRNSPWQEVMFKKIVSSGRMRTLRGFGTKKVPYRPRLTDDDKTKQSIEKYWNYWIALSTKITSSSMKCLPEERDVPSNKPEIDYVELANEYSDAASEESTDKLNASSSSVGRTDPEAVAIEDFNNTSQIADNSGSFVQGRCITTKDTANGNKTPLQISQTRKKLKLQ